MMPPSLGLAALNGAQAPSPRHAGAAGTPVGRRNASTLGPVGGSAIGAIGGGLAASASHASAQALELSDVSDVPPCFYDVLHQLSIDEMDEEDGMTTGLAKAIVREPSGSALADPLSAGWLAWQQPTRTSAESERVLLQRRVHELELELGRQQASTQAAVADCDRRIKIAQVRERERESALLQCLWSSPGAHMPRARTARRCLARARSLPRAFASRARDTRALPAPPLRIAPHSARPSHSLARSESIKRRSSG
jgi:hypothetical protein